jgi:hypothetical protein
VDGPGLSQAKEAKMGRTASGELGMIRKAHVAGAAAGNMTVTGIALGDKLISVVRIDAAGANLVGEFTVTAADTINNTGGTSTAGQTVLVEWETYGGGRDGLRVPTGRYPY